MSVNIDIVHQQVDFVRNELLQQKLSGEAKLIVLATYRKEDYEKLIPDENYEDFMKEQELFIEILIKEGISQQIVFQAVDAAGFFEFIKATGGKNDPKNRAYYAVVKYQHENMR